MNHQRIVRTVCFITVGYVMVLAVWLGWLVDHTPPATIPYQIMGLLAAFGSALGLGMMAAGRPSRKDRKLERHGLEGWARIEHVTPLRRTVDNGELTELDLRLTVPGSDSYNGRVVYEVRRENITRFVPGETISILVDPKDRDHIMLRP
ncbi:hypothetical protein [Rhodococcus marinonascens]|uniref:hypothetical protein n=1 Tax=Rhodococcus marinonascens TaxID=38311 RepID=UPI0009343E97|nr:hypothetical protein [Rhodococcus marinonascens]